MIGGPHDFKIARKGRVKRCYAIAFVVTKNIFIVAAFCSTRDKHKENKDTSEKYVSVKFHSNKNRVGGSRIDELRKYGSTGFTQTLTSGSNSEGVGWTGYTLSHVGSTVTGTLQYRDYADGYTMITGNTTGFTKEEVFNYALTRNEHFLGFVEQPRVYSDVFVSRGKQGVLENNLRLGEIDNLGELDIYGNGFFVVKKQ